MIPIVYESLAAKVEVKWVPWMTNLHYIRHKGGYEHVIQLNILVFQNILQSKMA